jgi:hypothetical protein
MNSGRKNCRKDIVRQWAFARRPEGVTDSEDYEPEETGPDAETPKSAPEEGLP